MSIVLVGLVVALAVYVLTSIMWEKRSEKKKFEYASVLIRSLLDDEDKNDRFYRDATEKLRQVEGYVKNGDFSTAHSQYFTAISAAAESHCKSLHDDLDAHFFTQERLPFHEKMKYVAIFEECRKERRGSR